MLGCTCDCWCFPLTLPKAPSAVSEGRAALAALAGFVAFVVVGSWEGFESCVFGPEGASPLPAESLVVDAVSSMGAGPPTDCASFTTSRVICSAITICRAVVAAEGSLSEGRSLQGEEEEDNMGGIRRGRVRPAVHVEQVEKYSPSVRCKASPRGVSWRFRRNDDCCAPGAARRRVGVGDGACSSYDCGKGRRLAVSRLSRTKDVQRGERALGVRAGSRCRWDVWVRCTPANKLAAPRASVLALL
jgi:hypothetical protein